MARQTIKVDQIREWANTFLAAPDSQCTGETTAERQHQRLGVIAMVEATLHHTGNYRGWNHLAGEYLPAEEQTPGNVLRPGYDNTRRRYH